MTQIVVTNKWKSEFKYDGLGRRRVRQEYNWVSGNWSLASETRYVYDGMLVIQERDGSNARKVSYTRGLDLSETLQGAGGVGGLLARTENTSYVMPSSYYVCDASGNVTTMVNIQGNIVARYVYDPFGRTIGMSGWLADANPYRFSSKEQDGKSGLYYYGYRFYEPNLQRWLNQDPIGEKGGINLYQFARNNPLYFVDRSGLDVYVIITIDGGPVTGTDHVDVYVDNPNGGYFGSTASWGGVRDRWPKRLLPTPDNSTVVKRIICDKETDKKVADFMKAKKSSSVHIPGATPYCASWSGECLNAGFPGYFPFGTGTFADDLSAAVDNFNLLGPPVPVIDSRKYFFP